MICWSCSSGIWFTIEIILSCLEFEFDANIGYIQLEDGNNKSIIYFLDLKKLYQANMYYKIETILPIKCLLYKDTSISYDVGPYQLEFEFCQSCWRMETVYLDFIA